MSPAWRWNLRAPTTNYRFDVNVCGASNDQPKRRTSRRAYTLMELAIVLAIMSALVAVSWPVLMKPWQKSQVQEAAERLREQLLKTRMASITEGVTYQFKWKPGTNEYEIHSKEMLPAKEAQHGAGLNGTGLNGTGLNGTGLSDAGLDGIGQHGTGFANEIQTSSVGNAPNVLETNALASRIDELSLSKYERRFLARGRLGDGIVFAENEPLLNADLGVLGSQDPNRQVAADQIQNHSMEQSSTQFGPTDQFAARDDVGQPNNLGQQGELNATQQDPSHPQHFDWSSPVDFRSDGTAGNAELTLQSDDGYSTTIHLRGLLGSATIGPIFRTPVLINNDPNQAARMPDQSATQPQPTQGDWGSHEPIQSQNETRSIGQSTERSFAN